jgi:hypothetical protein
MTIVRGLWCRMQGPLKRKMREYTIAFFKQKQQLAYGTEGKRWDLQGEAPSGVHSGLVKHCNDKAKRVSSGNFAIIPNYGRS